MAEQASTDINALAAKATNDLCIAAILGRKVTLSSTPVRRTAVRPEKLAKTTGATAS